MTENKVIKKKLIIQSFMPLFVILGIKNYDTEMWKLFVKLMDDLADKNWGIVLRIPGHPLFLTCIFEFICIFWVLYAVCGIFEFNTMQTSNFVSQAESIVECENISDCGVAFFMTYVLPMIMDDLGTVKGLLIFILLMIMLWLLMWKTNLYYQNPILTILGYEIVSFKFEHTQLSNFQNKNCVGITRKINVEEGMQIKRQYIADNVFIIYKDL